MDILEKEIFHFNNIIITLEVKKSKRKHIHVGGKMK